VTGAQIVAEVRAQGGEVFVEGPKLVVQRVPRRLLDAILERKAEVVRELLQGEGWHVGLVPTADDVVAEAARLLRQGRWTS
jgi:hypothetical protein